MSEDEARRNALIVEFIARRQAMGIGARPLAAAANVRRNSVLTLERRRPFDAKVSTLTGYADLLDLRLVLDVTGVDLVDPAPSQALRACGFIGSALLGQMVATRRGKGVTRRQLAAAAADGWNAAAVADVDRHDREPYLSTLQRYARGLGGRLDMGWEELC